MAGRWCQRKVRAFADKLDLSRSPNVRVTAASAKMHVAMRADELLEAGDMDGRRVWLRVLEAVLELSSKEPPDDATAVH